MSRTFRRFEVLLPLRSNEGTALGEDLVAETLLELRQKLGAVSCETQTIRGFWPHQEQVYRDDLVRVFVDVADDAENRKFFVEYKERLKVRFRQIEIWLTTYLIEAL